MASYRLLTYRSGDGFANVGLLIGDQVVDLAAELKARGSNGIPTASVDEILSQWDAARPVLEEIAARPEGGTAKPIGEVTLLAPIANPGAIYCAAANYYDHAREMSSGRELDKSKIEPYFFIKSSGAVTAPGAAVHLPVAHSQKFDWEAELAAVVGRAARNLTLDDALDCLAGYTICNDMSARDHMKREDWPFGSDWFSQKSWENSAPMGPWITPASDVPDPQNLTIKTWVSGELMQDSSTNQMVFSVAELLVALSRQITLKPGDVVPTGTCAGVGAAKGRFLKPGDDVKIEIERLGTLANPCVAGE
jgi:2-keto-4-pentenoate hydratase/2-oxohepta-3-ene-1,7-dioic acid hydratase in catechol pathway